MGFATFWASLTGPRVREITPPKNRNAAFDQRPATSSGVRTIRRTPSLDEDDGRELNQVESLVTRNVIEPPPSAGPTAEEKKVRRRSRGLSLSRSRTDDGTRRRRSIFVGRGGATEPESVPEVPTLPTLSSIYSRQAPQPHHFSELERPGTAVSTLTTTSSPTSQLPVFGGSPRSPVSSAPPKSPATQRPVANNVGQVFELSAETPATSKAAVAELPAPSVQVKKARRRSIGEVLSGRRSKSMGDAGSSSRAAADDAPPTPALPVDQAKAVIRRIEDAEQEKASGARSRRNSNASVASKASRMSRKSKRKSWWQRGKDESKDEIPLLPMARPAQSSTSTLTRGRRAPEDANLSAFPSVPLPKQFRDADNDDDAASIRTTRSQKATARSSPPAQPPQPTAQPPKKRPQSTASHIRRKRRSSWWASSNPDDSDDDAASHHPLPPLPLLSHSAHTTPETSPANSDSGFPPFHPTPAVRGDNTLKAPRPISGISTKSAYTGYSYKPRSAAKSFLLSTTPVAEPVRKSVIRHSLAATDGLGDDGEGDGSGNGNGRATAAYCLSTEQQREWEKLKHLMAVMERRRDVTSRAFGEESVAEAFPDVPRSRGRKSGEGGGEGGGAKEGRGSEVKAGVKYANRDALAALEVGVAK